MDLSYRLGRSEARAELTERAESTLREERDRLARELEEERAERRRLVDRLEGLEGGSRADREAVVPSPAGIPSEDPAGSDAETRSPEEEQLEASPEEAPHRRPWWLRWLGG